MKINRLLLGMMALALVPTSCSRHQDTADGNVLFSVATEGQVDVVTKSNVSDYTTLPQTGKFTIVLTNGILKSEWLYKMTIPTREVCKLELCRIIDFYNTQRPHMSIGWHTPEQAHNQCGEQQRCWKNYYRQAVASEDPQLGVYAPELSRLTEETLTEEVAV